MTSQQELKKALDGCHFETVQDEPIQVVRLSPEQKKIFDQVVCCLFNNLDVSQSPCTVTFRGTRKADLTEQMIKESDEVSEEKLLYLLFYFGNKAKNYYKEGGLETAKLRWPTKIEDVSPSFNQQIFEKIRSLLKGQRGKITQFVEEHKRFADFFQGNGNKDKFSEALMEIGVSARDYYLYFLHTADAVGENNKSSFLVSSSRSYKTAQKFAGDTGDRFVIFYVVPSPLNNFAVTHSRVMNCEAALKEHQLPSYEGDALYPEEDEVAIKGALFAQHTLGVKVEGTRRFIVNPHIFDSHNEPSSIIDGLKIDQKDFETRLNSTNYYRAVGITLDGRYHTIHATS
jgi:hypothetical protein